MANHDSNLKFFNLYRKFFNYATTKRWYLKEILILLQKKICQKTETIKKTFAIKHLYILNQNSETRIISKLVKIKKNNHKTIILWLRKNELNLMESK